MYWSFPSGRRRLSRSSRYLSFSASLSMVGATGGQRRDGRRSAPHHTVLERAETVDAGGHDVAGLQETGRLAAAADAARRAGEDQVAGLERADAGEVGD